MMKNIPIGCYWGIKKPFDPILYFTKNGFKLLSKENLNASTNVDIKKLWQRKYLFIGHFKAISIETNEYFFFFEQHPSQLYHCDLPNAKISNETNQSIVCFFWYPDSKSCGVKVYANNQLIRHIESEFDYSISINLGNLLENEDDIINISKTFNEQQLTQYLINAKIDLPGSINPSTTKNAIVYTLIR